MEEIIKGEGEGIIIIIITIRKDSFMASRSLVSRRSRSSSNSNNNKYHNNNQHQMNGYLNVKNISKSNQKMKKEIF